MSASKVPLVLTALYTRATTAMPNRQVVDGPPLRNLGQNYATIGWVGEDHPGVAKQQSIVGMRGDREQFEVLGQLVSWAGSTDPIPTRVKVYADLDAFDDVIGADRTLGGTCMNAQVVETSLLQAQSGKGIRTALTFVIRVDAFK